MILYTGIKACRNCGSDRLDEMLSLGNLAISGFTLPQEKDDYVPLTLLQCADCSLVQLQHTVGRDRLYRDYYYRSATNESMVKALKEIVDDAVTRIPFPDSKDTAALDIGCNDGTLLRMYPKIWMRNGVEPCRELAQEARKDTTLIATNYFPGDIPGLKLWSPYNIITSIAMFYDLDDPNEFVAAIKDWLHPDGIWVVQMPRLDQMLCQNAFDSICHEHLCYWPLHALLQLTDRHGLELVHMSTNTVNGGSTRYIFKHATRQRKPTKARWFWNHHFDVFRQNIERLRRQTNDMLRNLSNEGNLMFGYGASTKGNTLLQWYGIRPDTLPAIVDRNPDKWGKETTGSRIPIFGEQLARDMRPDYMFVLPWHFIDSFKQRESDWLRRGGQFIVPLPELSVVGGDPCQSTAAAH